MTNGFSEAEARLLDRIVPPPLAAGFADRVMARLQADTMPPSRRRDARGGWRRGRIALIAGVGSALLSVGAAAAGLLGARVQNMPVITTIATAVDAPRATPVTVVVARPKVALAKPHLPASTRESEVSTTVPLTEPAAGQLLANQIEARMKRRDAKGLSVPSLAQIEARRDAMMAYGDPRVETMTAALAILKGRDEAGGLPSPRTQREVKRGQWRERMAALTPEERAAAMERRKWRQQQRLAAAENGAAPVDNVAAPPSNGRAERPANGQRLREKWMQMTPEERAVMRAKRQAREAAMTPEQREAMLQRRAERRQRMLQGREGMTGGPEPAPPESDTPQ